MNLVFMIAMNAALACGDAKRRWNLMFQPQY